MRGRIRKGGGRGPSRVDNGSESEREGDARYREGEGGGGLACKEKEEEEGEEEEDEDEAAPPRGDVGQRERGQPMSGRYTELAIRARYVVGHGRDGGTPRICSAGKMGTHDTQPGLVPLSALQCGGCVFLLEKRPIISSE